MDGLSLVFYSIKSWISQLGTHRVPLLGRCCEMVHDAYPIWLNLVISHIMIPSRLRGRLFIAKQVLLILPEM
jgi:hypothetical protein